MVEAPRSPHVDFSYRIYNADGNEVEQCGNGARCSPASCGKKLTGKNVITVTKLPVALSSCACGNRQDVEVDMGYRSSNRTPFHFKAAAVAAKARCWWTTRRWKSAPCRWAIPTPCSRVDSAADAAVERLGPLIEAHLTSRGG